MLVLASMRSPLGWDVRSRRRPRREMDQSLYQQRMQQELGATAGLELGQHAAHDGGGDQHHGGAAGQVLQPSALIPLSQSVQEYISPSPSCTVWSS